MTGSLREIRRRKHSRCDRCLAWSVSTIPASNLRVPAEESAHAERPGCFPEAPLVCPVRWRRHRSQDPRLEHGERFAHPAWHTRSSRSWTRVRPCAAWCTRVAKQARQAATSGPTASPGHWAELQVQSPILAFPASGEIRSKSVSLRPHCVLWELRARQRALRVLLAAWWP